MKKILLSLLVFGGVSSQVAFCTPAVARWAELLGRGVCYLVPDDHLKKEPAKKKRPDLLRVRRAWLVRVLERERLTRSAVHDSRSSLCPVPLSERAP